MPSFPPMMKNALLPYLAVALYMVSFSLICYRLLAGPSKSIISRHIAIFAGLVGTGFHAIVLYQHILTENGLNLGFFNTFSLVAWTVVLLLLLSSLSKPVENLGIVVLPIAVLTLLLDTYFTTAHMLPHIWSVGMKIHILVSLLSYSLFAMASVQALLLAIQDHHLHNRQPGGIIRSLPPLQTMEALLFEMIGAGFALLTLALISGFVYLENMFAQHLVHKTILSFTAWLVFGTLLWGRYRYGWRGRTALTWTMVGFVVLMLAYFGSKAVAELILTK